MRECTGEFNMVDVKFCVSFVFVCLSVAQANKVGMHLASFYRQ